jgi:hypothetical protein
MTTHHLTDSELDLYRKRGMAPERLLGANSHLLSCDECYERYGAEDKVEAAFAILRDLQSGNDSESEHLSFEQLADYVDDKVDEKSSADICLHLRACAECETRRQEFAMLKPLVEARAARQVEERPSLRERFMAFLQPRLALQLTSLLLIAALLLWAVSLQRRINGLEREVSELEKANQVLAQNPDHLKEPSAPQNNLPGNGQPAPPGEREVTPAIVLALTDGSGRITLDERGNLTGLSQLSPAYESSVKKALTGAPLQLPPMPSGAGQADVFMGSAEEESFALLSPVGKVVQSARPTFRWKALKGAASYQVFLKDSTGKIMESGELTASEWTVEAPLKRGMLYTWQVVALKNGREVVSPPPSHAAVQVKILEQAEVEELAQLRRSHPNSHLLLGILYARIGLLDEAAREFTILLRNNPQSDVVKKWLNTVKAHRS